MITNHILRAIPLREFDAVFPHLKVIELRTRSVLYRAGETVSRLYFLDHGIVACLGSVHGGRRTAISIIGAEGLVGADSLFSGIAGFDATVELAGRALAVDLETLRQKVDIHAVLNNLILKYTNALLIQIAQTGLCTKVHSIQQRACRWLLFAQDRYEGIHCITRANLARFIGASLTTLTSITDNMEQAGLVSRRQGLISVADHNGLAANACSCYQTISRAYANLTSST